MSAQALWDRLALLQQRVPRGISFGLERVTAALAQLGDPQRAVPAVHIAGTNGKGSTSAMVEAIARAAGLRTGLYTSPHLCRVAERIRIDGEPIDDAAFARALDAVLGRCRSDLTFFESLTIAGFEAFREAGVDVAVIEVGLGGRLDATNTIEAPLATAITSIALEHTEYLGDTPALIAREKAGILKRGAPVVLGPLDPEADAAIAEVAATVGAGPITRVTREWAKQGDFIHVRESGDAIEMVAPSMAEPIRARLALAGPHQTENAGVAVGLALQLAARWPAVRAAIPRGLEAARWPGRLERIARGEVTVLLDAAHNPHGAEALAAALRRENLDPSRAALVFGALADKRWRPMLEQIAPFAARRYYAAPKGRAPASLAELAEVAPGEAIAEPTEAVARALAEAKPGDTVIVTGSIYLIGEVRAWLLGIEADPVIAL